VIVDDGSTDDSARIVENIIAGEPKMRLLRRANGGVCRARNAGFAAASPHSEYLLFLDADDCLEPEMLAVLAGHLDEYSRAGIAFCAYRFIDEQDSFLPTPPAPRYVPTFLGLRALRPEETDTPIASMLMGAPVLTCVSLLRRCVYEKTDGWDEALGQHHEELDLFLRMALKNRVHYVPQRLYRYRRYGGQSSGKRSSEEELKLLQQWDKFQKKWKSPSEVDATQRALIEACWRIREGRYIAAGRMLDAVALCKRGRIYPALRAFIGGVTRYVSAFRFKDYRLYQQSCRS
jgi:glycosyltransferase involved in cell wall biosynthesis